LKEIGVEKENAPYFDVIEMRLKPSYNKGAFQSYRNGKCKQCFYLANSMLLQC